MIVLEYCYHECSRILENIILRVLEVKLIVEFSGGVSVSVQSVCVTAAVTIKYLCVCVCVRVCVRTDVCAYRTQAHGNLNIL